MQASLGEKKNQTKTTTKTTTTPNPISPSPKKTQNRASPWDICVTEEVTIKVYSFNSN